VWWWEALPLGFSETLSRWIQMGYFGWISCPNLAPDEDSLTQTKCPDQSLSSNAMDIERDIAPRQQQQQQLHMSVPLARHPQHQCPKVSCMIENKQITFNLFLLLCGIIQTQRASAAWRRSWSYSSPRHSFDASCFINKSSRRQI
jgi:hypothetical protein